MVPTTQLAAVPPWLLFVCFFVWSIESLPLCCEDGGAQPFGADFFRQLFGGQRRLHGVEVLFVVVRCYMHMYVA